MELSLQEVCWGGILGPVPVDKGKERRGGKGLGEKEIGQERRGKEKEEKRKKSGGERRNQNWQTEKLDCRGNTTWPQPISSSSQVAQSLRPALVYRS